jgi:hypothetical protein
MQLSCVPEFGDGERARPVRAPQAASEAGGIKYPGKRIANVRERIRLPGPRADLAKWLIKLNKVFMQSQVAKIRI